MRPPILRASLAAALAPTVITGAAGSAAAAAPTPTAPRAEVAAPPLLWDAVAALPVANENRDGYTRRSFKHWTDADRDGCSTRAEVLIEEAITAPTIGPRCALAGGSWYSYYDDVTVTDARSLDVDHLVPLAEAWDSGAGTWTAARREAYANYLDAPEHLVAVTARANRQKADKDVADWLPIPQARCRYVTEWTSVKRRWALTVDGREKERLTTLAHGCPNVPLPS